MTTTIRTKWRIDLFPVPTNGGMYITPDIPRGSPASATQYIQMDMTDPQPLRGKPVQLNHAQQSPTDKELTKITLKTLAPGQKLLTSNPSRPIQSFPLEQCADSYDMYETNLSFQLATQAKAPHDDTPPRNW